MWPYSSDSQVLCTSTSSHQLLRVTSGAPTDGGGGAGPGERVLGGVPAVVERAGRPSRACPACRCAAERLPERPVRRQPRPGVGGVDVVGRAAGGPGPGDLLGQARVDVERAAAVDADDAEVGGGRQRAAALRVGHVVAALPGAVSGHRGCVGGDRRRQSGQRSRSRQGCQQARRAVREVSGAAPGPCSRSSRVACSDRHCGPALEVSGPATLTGARVERCRGRRITCGHG